jgi:hypothetical protein
VLTATQWAAFEQVHDQRIGAAAAQVLPWLLEKADPRHVARTLAALPETTRAAYHSRWQPDFAVLDRWRGRT